MHNQGNHYKNQQDWYEDQKQGQSFQDNAHAAAMCDTHDHGQFEGNVNQSSNLVNFNHEDRILQMETPDVQVDTSRSPLDVRDEVQDISQ